MNTLLQHSAAGSIWGVTTVTMLGGISEEYYFRRALLFHQPTARTQLLIPTLAYVLVTATSGIVLLTFAALLVGITTALLTIASERILPAIIAHLLWSASMLYLLPLITAGWAFTG
ncbi:MAG: CPBP family glutamic-type intramembrane protease [Actinomycetaceae bacterium]|nr:CPBP family glutamic-type intramembrane protease [Actinomycetaceae bacterium]